MHRMNQGEIEGQSGVGQQPQDSIRRSDPDDALSRALQGQGATHIGHRPTEDPDNARSLEVTSVRGRLLELPGQVHFAGKDFLHRSLTPVTGFHGALLGPEEGKEDETLIRG